MGALEDEGNKQRKEFEGEKIETEYRLGQAGRTLLLEAKETF